MSEEVRVSTSPVFDFERAILAKETIAKEGFGNLIHGDMPQIRAAGNLWLYNAPDSSCPQILSKLKALREREIHASNPHNPLPTIGWEVESPRKPFKPSLCAQYALFFDLMEMPRNKNNANVVAGVPTTYSSFWEFSTHPAYSAAVANRTLHELIKGGFIPYLQSPATAQDRYDLLDGKLVSLHINLGVPLWLSQSGNLFSDHPEVELLASSFELAYTSSERLLHREQTVIVSSKDAVPTNKHQQTELGPKRFEVKALEVSDARTYRLMEEIQFVGAAAFCAIGGQQELLGNIWRSTQDQIARIYKRYSIEPIVVKNKGQASALVKETAIQNELRRLLTASAHRVRELV